MVKSREEKPMKKKEKCRKALTKVNGIKINLNEPGSCPKCGKQVSQEAKFCPHCGYVPQDVPTIPFSFIQKGGKDLWDKIADSRPKLILPRRGGVGIALKMEVQVENFRDPKGRMWVGIAKIVFGELIVNIKPLLDQTGGQIVVDEKGEIIGSIPPIEVEVE